MNYKGSRGTTEELDSQTIEKIGPIIDHLYENCQGVYHLGEGKILVELEAPAYRILTISGILNAIEVQSQQRL